MKSDLAAVRFMYFHSAISWALQKQYPLLWICKSLFAVAISEDSQSLRPIQACLQERGPKINYNFKRWSTQKQLAFSCVLLLWISSFWRHYTIWNQKVCAFWLFSFSFIRKSHMIMLRSVIYLQWTLACPQTVHSPVSVLNYWALLLKWTLEEGHQLQKALTLHRQQEL